MSDVDVVSPSSLTVDSSVQEETQKVFDTQQSLASPPFLPPPEDVPREQPDGVTDGDEALSPKADSEAETIIQSSRESVSPEKRRKYIQHEGTGSQDQTGEDASVDTAGSPSGRKRRRIEHDPRGDEQDPRKASPRLRASSVSHAVKMEDTDGLQNITGRQDSMQSGSAVHQTDSGDPNSRKRSSSESAIDGDVTDSTNNRIRVSDQEDSTHDRERRGKTLPTPGVRQSKDRSLSPAFRTHKRAVSGPQHGAGENLPKKKKTPAPLITGRHRHSSEDRQSMSSSASGSPMPTAHIRRLTSSDGAATSPAKTMTHKKQRDQNGRTRLARACAAHELEGVMARHAERPEDLNVADNAGNTPLQIAALEGCAPIVKFLLGTGCEIDTKNIDRDTPLIDAVENGHLDVVKLLIDAGANPRMVNAEGDEPYDLVPSDTEEYEEIRRIIAEAKTNPRKRRSEDHGVRANSSKDSVPRATSASSPRESPPAHVRRSPPLAGISGRRRTVRSEATRNDLLWTKATPENLRDFAAKGDMAGVANILNVGQKADTESLIAAAKGGHDDVMQLLLGIGYADPDPEPLQNGNLRPGYNTPMLAAIGRGNLDVIKLLLDQPGFNSTRRLFRDRTYFELARERKGEAWEEESELLRASYDSRIRNRKMRRPETKSPRRSRDKEKDGKRLVRRESSSPVALHSRKGMRSPMSTRHADGPKDPSARDKIREDHLKEKSATSGLDHTRSDHSKSRALGNEKRDSAGNRGDEVVVKRRRLIAGRPPQPGERRPSQLSSDSLSGHDESKPRAERVDAVRRNSPSLKRSRSSVSPERSRSRGPEQRREEEIQKKKRRVLAEDNAQKLTNGTKRSQDSLAEQLKNSPSQEVQNMPDSERSKSSKLDAMPEKDAIHFKSSDEPVPVKEEQKKLDSQDLDDIPMDEAAEGERAEAEAQKQEETRRREEEALKVEEERILEEKRAAEAERTRIAKEEEEAREAAERAARLAREKAEEEDRNRKEAEQRRLKQAEEERQRRLEQERLRIAKMRREQEEQEQRRRDALPNRLRVAANLVGSNDPRARSHTWLRQFMPVVTVTTEQIDSSCQPEIANERWVPNFLVAPLLATNDLQLSQYASWEKRKATPTQRANLWRVTRRILVQADDSEFEGSSFGQVIQKDGETRPKYFEMEHVFWVRLSDFMDLVPHIPHLHGLEIQLLKMHIDREPAPFDGPQVNGNAFYPAEDHDSFPVNGLTNGFGHAYPSTYV